MSADLAAQLRAVRDEAGFLGTSPDEVQGSYAILQLSNDPQAGIAAHLGAIGGHGGEASARAVTWRYGRYGDKARADLFHLRELQTDIVEQCGERSGEMRLQELGVRVIGADGGIMQGGSQLVRFRDLGEVADGRRTISPFTAPSRSERPAVDPYTVAEPERGMRLYMGNELGGMRLLEVRGLLTAAIVDQEARLAFWTLRVGGNVSSALAARAVVRQAVAQESHAGA